MLDHPSRPIPPGDSEPTETPQEKFRRVRDRYTQFHEKYVRDTEGALSLVRYIVEHKNQPGKAGEAGPEEDIIEKCYDYNSSRFPGTHPPLAKEFVYRGYENFESFDEKASKELANALSKMNRQERETLQVQTLQELVDELQPTTLELKDDDRKRITEGEVSVLKGFEKYRRPFLKYSSTVAALEPDSWAHKEMNGLIKSYDFLPDDDALEALNELGNIYLSKELATKHGDEGYWEEGNGGKFVKEYIENPEGITAFLLAKFGANPSFIHKEPTVWVAWLRDSLSKDYYPDKDNKEKFTEALRQKTEQWREMWKQDAGYFEKK